MADVAQGGTAYAQAEVTLNPMTKETLEKMGDDYQRKAEHPREARLADSDIKRCGSKLANHG